MTGGEGITVEGAGTADNPYIIAVDAPTIAGTIQFVDTDTVDFTVTGSGTEANPYQVRADATLALDDLTDVDAADPPDNYVLAWNGSAWVPSPPATVDPGAITTAEPVVGDGSSSDPITLDLVTGGLVSGSGTAADPLTATIVHDASLVGAGTAASPLRAAIRYAAGTAQVTNIREGNAGRTTVTFPAGRFTDTPYITLGMYTSVPAHRFPGHIDKTETGFIMAVGYDGASTSVEVWVTWHAIQQSPSVSASARAGLLRRRSAGLNEPPATSPADTIATCETSGCDNQGIGIPVVTQWTDEDGNSGTVDEVQCGPCGYPISNLVPIS